MFDPRLAEEYFVAAHLLKIFRRQTDVLPRSLEQLRSKWERIYPGVDSDLLQRFDEPTQLELLRNWSRLVDHANSLHGKLSHRIEKTSSELLNLRDSVSITDSLAGVSYCLLLAAAECQPPHLKIVYSSSSTVHAS